MPMYNVQCRVCDQIDEALLKIGVSETACVCGGVAEKVWAGCAPMMIRDSIRGGVVLENLTPQPKRFYSRTEIKDEMRARGVREMVRHVGVPGSDKSPFTQRMV